MYLAKVCLNLPYAGYRHTEMQERILRGCLWAALREAGVLAEMMSRAITFTKHSPNLPKPVFHGEIEVELHSVRLQSRVPMQPLDWIRLNNAINKRVDTSNQELRLQTSISAKPPTAERRKLWIRANGLGRKVWPYRVSNGKRVWVSGDPDIYASVWNGPYQTEEVLWEPGM